MSKTVQFQTIQLSISTQFSSIWPIDRTPSASTTPGQSGAGSDGNEGVLSIPQSSSITRTSTLVCLVSYNFLGPVSWGCRIHRLHFCRGVRPHSNEYPDMTLNNLMVRFQWCWSFRECRVPLYGHHSQVQSGPEW